MTGAFADILTSRRLEADNLTNLAPSKAGVDVLWDGEVQAEHRLGEPDVQIHLGDTPGMTIHGSGPFIWWRSFRMPSTLDIDEPEGPSSTHVAAVSGFHTAVEVYQVEHDAATWGPETWGRKEIYYDPSVGYLPRFVRSVGVFRGSANCKEYYLIKARPCAAGGFVPVESYEAKFVGDVPKHAHADKLDLEALRPTIAPLVTHLNAIHFVDLHANVYMDGLRATDVIVGKGGPVPVGSMHS